MEFDAELALAAGGVRPPGICACKASKNDFRSLPRVPSFAPIAGVEEVEAALVEDDEPPERRSDARLLKSFCSASIAAPTLVGPLEDVELDGKFDLKLAFCKDVVNGS